MNTLLEFLLYSQGSTPYFIAFLVLLACGLGVPIPEDITLFTMGLLSYYGLVDIKVSIFVCLAGVLIGDGLIFFLGYRYGSSLVKHAFFSRFLTHDHIVKAQSMFHKMGNKVIFAARFMPGLRAAAYFTAGTLKLPAKIFFFYDGIAAIISVPLLVGVVYHFGSHVDRVIRVARKIQHGIAFLILGFIVLLVAKHFYMKSKSKKPSKKR